MKYTLFILLGISFPFSALAIDPPSLQFDTGPGDDVRTIQVTSIEINELEGDPDRPVISGTTDSSVGGDGEDIGASMSETTGTEIEDIGKMNKATGIEHEDIGIEEPVDAAQYEESDFNFVNRTMEGETTDKDHKGEIDILSTGTTEKAASGFLKLGDIKGESSDTSMEPGDEIMVLLRPAPGADNGNNKATSTRMNKSDLIVRLHTADVFIKLGDIKGESSDSAAKTSKPKEIVVVGSKARDEGTPQIVAPKDPQATTPDSFFDIFIDVSTDDDVQLHALAIAQQDENIERVELRDREISVYYNTTIRLLGIIPVRATERTIITFGDGERGAADPDEIGRVKVQLPWWHFFGRKTVRPHDLEIAIEQGLKEATTKNVPTEEVVFNFEKIKARTLQTMSNVLKASH